MNEKAGYFEWTLGKMISAAILDSDQKEVG